MPPSVGLFWVQCMAVKLFPTSGSTVYLTAALPPDSLMYIVLAQSVFGQLMLWS
jgi:hypothetical protein